MGSRLRYVIAGAAAAILLASCSSAGPDTDASSQSSAATSQPSESQPEDTSVQGILDGLSDLTGEARRQYLRERAAAAGPVVIYSSTSPSIIDPSQQAINEAYPDVDIQIIRLDTATASERLVAEAEAGQTVASAVGGAIAAPLLSYLDAGLLARYTSPESEGFDPAMVDPNGYWTAESISVMVIAWNTDLVSAQDAPKSMQDLTDPSLSGRLGRSASGTAWVGAMLEAYGETEGMQLIDAIAAQEPRIFDSNSQMADALASGQVAAVFDTQLVNIQARIDDGAPLEYSAYNPLYIQPTYQGVTAEAPNPWGAALYIDWVLSADGGQSILLDNSIMGPRPGMAFLGQDLVDQADQVISYSPTLLADADRYEQIFLDKFVRN